MRHFLQLALSQCQYAPVHTPSPETKPRPWWRSAKNEAVLRQLVNVLTRRCRGTRWREVGWIRLGGLERIGLQLDCI